jgi:hypothetical protein
MMSDPVVEILEKTTDPETGDEVVVGFIDGRFFHRGTQYKEDHATEVIATHKFDGPVAKVRRSFGLTLKLREFESARIDVGIDVPCYMEDAIVADEFACAWAKRRIREESKKVKGAKVNGIDDDGQGGY